MARLRSFRINQCACGRIFQGRDIDRVEQRTRQHEKRCTASKNMAKEAKRQQVRRWVMNWEAISAECPQSPFVEELF